MRLSSTICAAGGSSESGIGGRHSANATASRNLMLTSLFSQENSHALRDTSFRCQVPTGLDEARSDVALGPRRPRHTVLRPVVAARCRNNTTRLDRPPALDASSLFLGRLRICARPTPAALPKRKPQLLRRTNKKCLPLSGPTFESERWLGWGDLRAEPAEFCLVHCAVKWHLAQ